MNDNQENRHTRNKAADSFLDDQATVFAAIPDFVTQAAAIKAKNGEVEALRAIQEAPVTGPATDKANAEDIAITNVMVLADIMKAKALILNNNTLFESVNYSKTSLRSLRDTTLDTVLANLNQIALDNLAAIWSSSGMTAGMITTSTTSTTAYVALINAPRLKLDVRTSATQMIEPKLDEADAIITIIKRLGGQYRTSNTDFFNQLNSACEIIDLGGGGPPPPAK